MCAGWLGAVRVKPYIARAHRLRKMLEGGMRQAGILAAAGIVALEQMTGRGCQPCSCKKLAQGLRQVPGLVLAQGTPATNMVFLSLTPDVKLSSDAFIERLKEHTVLIGATGSGIIRLVTHYWIEDADVEEAVDAFRSVLSKEI